MLVVVALVVVAATQVAAQAATQASTVCHRVNGKIVHKSGEHCIVLHRTGTLVTVSNDS